MGWATDSSHERIKTDLARLDSGDGVTVDKLKTKADFENFTDKNCREIRGAHVYALISNFDEYATDATKTNDYKKFLRSVHVYQMVVAHIVEVLFDAVFVHFQGPKLHAVVYRPIDDDPAIAKKAFLLQLALHDFVVNVFNETTAADTVYQLASGSDLGDTIGTRNGQVTDREMLFIGDPANQAAKVLAKASARVRPAVYDQLPDEMKAVCTKSADGSHYWAKGSKDTVLTWLSDVGIDWDRDALKKRITDGEAAIPLGEISYSGADKRIDPDNLSIRNNKRVRAASVFADISGFTAFVKSRTDADGRKAALRAFHAIRRESSVICKTDYEGVRIQYQGDRIQAIFHLPNSDDAAIALEALRAAAAMHSALEGPLRDELGDLADIHYAVGIDIGTTLVTRLGAYGDRDRICLGDAVESAQYLEEKVASASEIAVSAAVHAVLPESVQGLFTQRASAYVVKDLTQGKLSKALKATENYKSVTVVKSEVGSGVAASAGASVTSTKPWRRD
jgi:class 3 adenylate cyclase